MAFCDTDCEDIDLEIYDSQGGTLGSDYDDTDFPVILLTAGENDRISAEASMAECSTERCYYGIALFGE